MQEYDKLSYKRSDALSTWDFWMVKNERERQLEEYGDVKWMRTPKLVKDVIDEYHPGVNQAYEEYFKQYGVMSQGDSRQMFKYNNQKAAHDAEVYGYMAQASILWERGELDGRGLNNALRSAAQMRRSFNRSLLEGEFKGLINYWTDLRNNRMENQDEYFQGDILFDAYMIDVVLHKDNEDDEGMFLPDVYERRKLDWEVALNVTEADKEYIEKRRTEWLDKAPLFAQLEKDKKILEPYWNIPDYIWPPGSEMNRAGTEYLEMTRSAKSTVTGIHREAANIIERERMSLRRDRADIDWYLAKYDFAQPVHTINKERHSQLIQIKAMKKLRGIHDTPAPNRYAVSPSGRATIISKAEASRRQTILGR